MVETNNYWENRSNERMGSYHKNSDETILKINAAYDKAIKDINEDINKIFFKYQKDSGLTPGELRDLLNSNIPKKELDSIRAKIKYINDEEIKKYMMAQLNANAYKARITRLEALKESINMNTKLIAEAELKQTNSLYINNINEAYYKNIYDIQKGTGLAFEFATMPVVAIEEILRNNWSGKHYSDRIWHNTDILGAKLEEVITAGLMQGKSSRRMALELQDLTTYGKMAAERLVRTETTYITNMAEIEAYKEAGIKEYVFVATLDLRTSETCRIRDKKVYEVSKATPGVNLPALHPWCRSTTIAYFGEDTLNSLQRRARDPESGKNYILDRNMSYKEWYKTHVVDKYGEQKTEVFEKMIKNKSSDRKQHEKYKEVLGKEVPKDLKEFQQMKYNNVNEWNDLRGYYSYKESNPLSDRKYYDINKEIKGLIDIGTVSSTIGTAVKPIPSEYTNIHKHALKRMNKRNINNEEASKYISSSKLMFRQNSNSKNAYYSEAGVAIVVLEEKLLVTVFSKSDYDDGAKSIMEVLNRNGI